MENFAGFKRDIFMDFPFAIFGLLPKRACPNSLELLDIGNCMHRSKMPPNCRGKPNLEKMIKVELIGTSVRFEENIFILFRFPRL